jgi:hypothetical protein
MYSRFGRPVLEENPFCRRLGWWRRDKSLLLSGVVLVASQFTDWAIRAVSSFVLFGEEKENIHLVVTDFVKGSMKC